MDVMLNKFDKIKDAVKVVLTDLNEIDKYPTEHELEVLTNLCNALEIIKVGTKRLCSRYVIQNWQLNMSLINYLIK